MKNITGYMQISWPETGCNLENTNEQNLFFQFNIETEGVGHRQNMDPSDNQNTTAFLNSNIFLLLHRDDVWGQPIQWTLTGLKQVLTSLNIRHIA